MLQCYRSGAMQVPRLPSRLGWGDCDGTFLRGLTLELQRIISRAWNIRWHIPNGIWSARETHDGNSAAGGMSASIRLSGCVAAFRHRGASAPAIDSLD